MPRGLGACRIIHLLVLAIAVVGFCTPLGGAQATGTAQGVVTDAQGGVLVGVTVTLRSRDDGGPPSATVTDQAGRYRFVSLGAGRYALTFELPGFETLAREVAVEAGAAVTVDARLSLAPLAEATVEVVGVTPVAGTGLDRDLLPLSVAILERSSLAGSRTSALASALGGRLGSVALNESTGNPYQPDVQFRGFTASPVLGLPQGIAVYQNGVRVNEPFGDTVPFDLVPVFALERVELSAGAQPVYGLNALGGSLALALKDGFGFDRPRVEASAGSFGRYEAIAEAGRRFGRWAFYGGAAQLGESGWRVASDSAVRQIVGDAAHRGANSEIGVTVIQADTSLNGNGPAPIDLVDVDRRAVFTYPDRTENRLSLVQSRASVGLTATVSVSGSAYYRGLDRDTLNGDRAEFGPCEIERLPAGAPSGTLCDDGDAALVDVTSGTFLTLADARGDGVLNRTRTATDGYGGSIQATAAGRLFERDQLLAFGATVDLADIAFGSQTELGSLTGERAIAPAGRFVGVFGEAPNDEFNVGLSTRHRALGLYFTETVSLTGRLHLTIDGRYNDGRLEITDNLGDALNGDHGFRRFNVGVGGVYRLGNDLSAYARYGEASRMPTAAELTCADPEEPCRVPNAFVSDPPLQQAVARSIEIGVRGRSAPGSTSRLDWSVAGFTSRVSDDILFVASTARLGAGFFRNAGDTARLGLEVDVHGVAPRADWYASYGFVRATFESSLLLPSDPAVNDAADEHGRIAVEPGNRLPGIPLHTLKAGLRLDLTCRWDVAVESQLASSQIFRGDEGNDQRTLGGYGIVSLRSAYRVTDRLGAFVELTNLFDAEYATFGVLGEVELDLIEAPGADDPRFISPGEPFAAMAGVRWRF